jgi:hypothetical protein
MKPKIYLETTIPSYLTAWPNRDLVIASHQQLTREWWLKRRGVFDLYISQFVIDEAKAGDRAAARERMKVIGKLPMLDITPDVGKLASAIVGSRVIPRRAATDAAHVAVATVHGMDFLLTWNCAHLANAVLAKKLARICRSQGYECPYICTPEALLEG